MKKIRFLSAVLCIVMLCALLPVQALATETVSNITYDSATDTLSWRPPSDASDIESYLVVVDLFEFKSVASNVFSVTGLRAYAFSRGYSGNIRISVRSIGFGGGGTGLLATVNVGEIPEGYPAEATPTALYWNGRYATWTGSAGATRYNVEFLFTDGLSGMATTSDSRVWWAGNPIVGTVFRVREVGNDTAAQPTAASAWSEWSTPYVNMSISGDTSMVLTEGYSATSTGAYTLAGNPMPTVTIESDSDKITWNSATNKLDIAPGIAGGTYHVTLTASNGVDTNATARFTLTVTQDGLVPYYTNDSGNDVIISISAIINGEWRYICPDDVTVKYKTNVKAFSDVSGWAVPFVKFATERSMFAGTSATSFSPDDGMTRAMLATVLYNTYKGATGEEYTGGGTAFSDVSAGSWYETPVKWASSVGIVSGVGNNMFAPDSLVTRQETVVMLYKFAKLMDSGVSAGSGSVAYPDSANIAVWAQEAALWAQNGGIISGKTGGVFAPTDNTTRAEAATIMSNFTYYILGD